MDTRTRGLNRVCDDIQSAIQALPGAESTAISSFSLISGSGAWDRLRISQDKRVGSFIGAVTPGFLETMQIQLLEGRDLSPDDRSDAPLVAIVNETFADKAFGAESAIGREFSSGEGEDLEVFRIVGVFRDGNSIFFFEPPHS